MVLNSSRLMPRLSCSYCGMVLYLANSACQSASPSGGMTPVTGFHSTIERPDSVSLVAPPTITMANTRAATHHSQRPTARAAEGLLAPLCAANVSSRALDGCDRTVMEPIALQGQSADFATMRVAESRQAIKPIFQAALLDAPPGFSGKRPAVPSGEQEWRTGQEDGAAQPGAGHAM